MTAKRSEAKYGHSILYLKIYIKMNIIGNYFGSCNIPQTSFRYRTTKPRTGELSSTCTSDELPSASRIVGLGYYIGIK